eukprot:7534150-Pyramimonas_sp.AAC.1
MVILSWNRVFSRIQVVQGISNMVAPCWSRSGTMCFHVSRPPRGISNMLVPRWNHAFLHVQATQEGIYHGGPELE